MTKKYTDMYVWYAKDIAKKFLDLDICQAKASDIFECCVDFDIYTQQLRSRLFELADRKDV